MNRGRFAVDMDQVTTRTIVVRAHNEQEARKRAHEALQRALYAEPEFLGDPEIEPPYIRGVRKLGD